MAEILERPPPGGVRRFAPAPHEIHTLPAGDTAWRVYRRQPYGTSWDTFRTHGPTTARFDHHLPSTVADGPRSILYAAAAYPTCLAEVFQDTRTIDLVSNHPRVAAFAFARDLRLLDVAGPWITRAGASMAINSGSRVVAREWSRAIYNAFPEIDGICYASSMDANATAYAFFERAKHDIRPSSPPFDAPLASAVLLADLKRAAQRIGYGLV